MMKLQRPRRTFLALAVLFALLPAISWRLNQALTPASLGATVTEILVIALLLLAIVAVPMSLVAAFLIPPREDDANWRTTVNLYRRNRRFAQQRPNAARIETAAATLTDEALLVAASLPDHSEAARALLTQEMNKRQLSGDPPAPIVPSFFSSDDKENLDKIVFGITAKIRIAAQGIGFIVFAFIIVLIVWNLIVGEQQVSNALSEGRISADEAEEYSGGAYDQTPPALRNDATTKEIVAREQIGIVAATLLIPCGLVIFSASWFRRKPVRVLLLRRFNNRRLGKVYSKLAKTELFPFGHVIALSDHHLKRGFRISGAFLAAASPAHLAFIIIGAPILFLLRLSDRTRWGPAYVANARDYRLLAKRLHDRMELNLQTTFSSYAYLVRSTDTWWKEIIRLFMESADAIVLDVSEISAGTAWEIDLINRYQLWNRVVIVSNSDYSATAEAAVQKLVPKNTSQRPILYYNVTGSMISREEFRSQMIGALRASITEKKNQPNA
jgi:hypothetical protein